MTLLTNINKRSQLQVGRQSHVEGALLELSFWARDQLGETFREGLSDPEKTLGNPLEDEGHRKKHQKGSQSSWDHIILL